MPSSTRFAVAAHALAVIANKCGEPITSERIAYSASTNPAVVRRLLSMLADAGLTRSQLGQGGGALLAKPPEQITLLDVYKAVEEPELVALHRQHPAEDCYIGRYIQETLLETTCAAERAFQARLAETSIADLLAEIRDKAGLPALAG